MGMKRTTKKHLMVFSGRAYPELADEVELDEDGDRLAWDISLDKADRQDADEVLVNAKTGEVVSTDG